MTARILVVDDTAANLKYLEARLVAEYFAVSTASSGMQALTQCSQGSVDLILLDVMMPGMDGFETCRRLKSDPATAHIPVVIVTALDQPSDRVKGLEAGADDFLTKPINETALLARVRSLVRLKMMTDQLRVGALTNTALSFFEPLAKAVADKGLDGRILLVDDRPGSIEKISTVLSRQHRVDVMSDAASLVEPASCAEYDLFFISLGLRGYDGLRLCSDLRSLESTRHIPILLLADLEDNMTVLRGLELGVNDFILRPLDANEVLARVRTQIRRKRYTDLLRDTVHASMELAIVDQLTGLHNRRYLDRHLPKLLDAAVTRGGPLSLMILDIDHFKAVNDTHGHDAGDAVLRIFADRVKAVIRDEDLLCRLGGEEFIVVMPALPLTVAMLMAERIRLAVSMSPFGLGDGGTDLSITVSIGLAERGSETAAHAVLKRADMALYRSKSLGRNQVCAEAA